MRFCQFRNIILRRASDPLNLLGEFGKRKEIKINLTVVSMNGDDLSFEIKSTSWQLSLISPLQQHLTIYLLSFLPLCTGTVYPIFGTFISSLLLKLSLVWWTECAVTICLYGQILILRVDPSSSTSRSWSCTLFVPVCYTRLLNAWLFQLSLHIDSKE